MSQLKKTTRLLTLTLLFGAAALSIAQCSCAKPASHYVLDAAMSSAHRPEFPEQKRENSTLYLSNTIQLKNGADGQAIPSAQTGYLLLSGDLHCHINPPDHAPHATRGLAQTIELANSEGLDFVVLTPHVGARFFQFDDERAYYSEALAQMERRVEQFPGRKPLFISGFEYTDHAYGHVGASFADLNKVLDAVPTAEAAVHPERFFEEYVKHGGVLIVNHPLVVPIDSIISIARADLSWRPFTSTGPFPPEINAIHRLAQGFEAYNLAATHLRDEWLVGETDHSLLATLRLLDKEILNDRRRMTPVGGSDSHSGHLRATTFVLARGKDADSLREAIVAGRLCVRDPGACSFQVRGESGEWYPVGGSLKAKNWLDLAAFGEDVEFILNGRSVSRLPEGGSARISIESEECSVVRARVDQGYSAPIYVNCPF